MEWNPVSQRIIMAGVNSKGKKLTCHTQPHSRWQYAHLCVWSHTALWKCITPYAKLRFYLFIYRWFKRKDKSWEHWGHRLGYVSEQREQFNNVVDGTVGKNASTDDKMIKQSHVNLSRWAKEKGPRGLWKRSLFMLCFVPTKVLCCIIFERCPVQTTAM